MNASQNVKYETPSDSLQHIQFEGRDVCVIAPEDYDALMDLLNRAGHRLAVYGSSSMETALLLDEIKLVGMGA